MGRALASLAIFAGAATLLSVVNNSVTSAYKNAQQKALQEEKALWLEKLETRKKQLQVERKAAEELRQKKFLKKVAWSAGRHAVLAILLPGLGNIAEKIYFTLDAMDLVDLVDMISDLGDHIDSVQNAHDSLNSTGDVHFGYNNVNPDDYKADPLGGGYVENHTSVTTDMAPKNKVSDWTTSQIQEAQQKIEEAKKAHDASNKFF